MPTPSNNTIEPLLRQIVPRLCTLAADCNPDLAARLTALREAAINDTDGATLQQAYARLSETVMHSQPPPVRSAPASGAASRSEAPLNTTEGRLIRDVLKHLLLPPSLEPLGLDIEQALGKPTNETGRRRLGDQLLHLLVESRTHAERRQAELQQFLKHTVGRLVQLETTISEANSLHQGVASQAQQGRQVTEAQFIQLRAVSEETDDLDQLKSFIGERLDHMQSHLRQQDTAGDVQQRRLEEHLSQLSQQVSQLSSETVTLRSRLDVTTEEALRDPLTGAYNRLAYDRRAALEVARWRSDGGDLSMIVCDIDRFKHINDTFGHTAGDKVLKEVVRLLQNQLRSSDFVARYGGEEFVVLLNGAAEQAALQIAEKLRRTIKAAPFRSRGERVAVTISCGVGTFAAKDTLESVFERTDAALYAAKAQGRDRCITAESKAA